MAEREHFTNGRTSTFATGFGLAGLSFGAQVSHWAHWTTVGVGYGSGGVLMLLSAIWISKSYYSNEQAQPLPTDSEVAALPEPVADEQPANLRDRTFALSKDLYQFLRELPPRLDLPDARTREKAIANLTARDNGRVSKLHHGYMHRFRDRVVSLAHELAEQGITLQAQPYELDPPEIQREKNLCRVAEDLKRIVVEMDIRSEGV